MAERRIIHYRGRVQGVGFRFTAREIASHYPVTGYVRNLPDGRVQLEVEGPAEQLDAYMSDIAQRMQGKIQDQQIERLPATGSFGDFSIRY